MDLRSVVYLNITVIMMCIQCCFHTAHRWLVVKRNYDAGGWRIEDGVDTVICEYKTEFDC